MSCAWYLVLTLLLRISGGTAVDWPSGVYALLKPTTGCPTGWIDKMWIFQDTEDTNPSNNRSETIHIDGHVSRSYVIRSFCIKKNDGGGPTWPDGAYCTYRRRADTTMTGIINTGWIQMEDETSINQDRFVFYSRSYRIYYENSNPRRIKLRFNCKIDENKKKFPISLPITKPFYLLPYGSRDCQQVKWMVATSEWIKYHTNNYIPKKNIKQTDGAVPWHELGDVNNKGITMYYCYYESCNYTLTDKKGVFQSPGFPGEYPDGQLCSWRIMVSDNHTLHVQFTSFYLDRNDNLTFFKNNSGIFYLNDTFHGHYNQPFTITATSDVLFEFLTNEEGNSTGFRAEYTVFKTYEMTPSPPSTNRNTGQHTTTIPTTETKNKTNNSTADTFKKSRVSECDGVNTAILIVIPLICLIVVIAIVIVILYRWRSKKTECEKCASSRHPKEDVTNPTYDDAGHIPIQQRTSTATMNTIVDTDDNDGQMYQALSHDQQPEYEAPDYSKQNGIDDPSMDSGYPEYHELEPMDNNVPDVVYDVLEGPDSNDGPSDDQMYQALDKETTHNPLYQSTQPAAMVTRNPMYVDSVA